MPISGLTWSSCTSPQLLGLHQAWKDKLALAFRDEITGAMADFFGLLTQLNQLLDPQSRCSAEGWYSLLFIDIFAKKLPRCIRDDLALELRAMDAPDVSKLTAILEKHWGAIMVGYTSYSYYLKRKAKVATAAAVHTQGGPEDDGGVRSRDVCMLEGCRQFHLL